MKPILALTALIMLAADARSQRQRDNEERNYEEPFLPKDPMVIQLNKEDHYESDPPRITYRGCHKFCVGTVEGRPDSDSVWNPFNLSADELYYFRYVKVNMRECKWAVDMPRQFQILELFFAEDEEDNGYVISRPVDQLTWDSFHFLIYNPDSEPSRNFRVRWTSYMNVCDTKESEAPIDTHYEPNAFDPAEYVSVFQDYVEPWLQPDKQFYYYSQ